MVNLYKPVFWCGFALSITALYASIDRSSADSEETRTSPPLLQIDSHLGNSASPTPPPHEPAAPVLNDQAEHSASEREIWQSRVEKILAESKRYSR